MFEAWLWKRIRWSLRKTSLPIKPTDLVLDVGQAVTRTRLQIYC